MKFAIFDLDNCLSNDGWRIPRIDWSAKSIDERYNAYHLLSGFDVPGNMAAFWKIAGRKDMNVIIATARPERYRPLTEYWLELCEIVPAKIMMRKDNDHSHSAELKRNFIDEICFEFRIIPEQIEFAFDDRPDVVEMYKRVGIRDAQVMAIHNICAYTPPRSFA